MFCRKKEKMNPITLLVFDFFSFFGRKTKRSMGISCVLVSFEYANFGKNRRCLNVFGYVICVSWQCRFAPCPHVLPPHSPLPLPQGKLCLPFLCGLMKPWLGLRRSPPPPPQSDYVVIEWSLKYLCDCSMHILVTANYKSCPNTTQRQRQRIIGL